jgi:hypothetical protein
LIIILFLHLLSTNYKCTQPCYFCLLLKPAAQKDKMDWNSSMKSSRLRVALVAVPVELWCLPLFGFVSLWRPYLCNNYLLFVTFGYLWTLLGHMCRTIDPGSCIWWVLCFGIKTGYHSERKPFSFINPFILSNLFDSKFKFKLWMIPIRKIKYKGSLSHNKICSGRNAIDKIIYLNR